MGETTVGKDTPTGIANLKHRPLLGVSIKILKKARFSDNLPICRCTHDKMK